MVRIATLIATLLVLSYDVSAQCFRPVDPTNRLAGREVDVKELYSKLEELVRDIGKYETSSSYVRYLDSLLLQHPWMKDTLVVTKSAKYSSYNPDRSELSLIAPLRSLDVELGSLTFPGASRNLPGYNVYINRWNQAVVYLISDLQDLGTYTASNALGVTVEVKRRLTTHYGFLSVNLEGSECTLGFRPVLRIEPAEAQQLESVLQYAYEFVLDFPYWVRVFEKIIGLTQLTMMM